MKDVDREFDAEERPPERLIEGLNRLYGEPIRVPPELDRIILNRARAAMTRRGHGRLLLRWGGAAAAVAAAIIIAVRYTAHPAPPATPTAITLPREDVNGDGRIDILDAYVLARELQTASPSSGRDINSDGVVDEKDVDAIARAAVSLEGVQ